MKLEKQKFWILLSLIAVVLISGCIGQSGEEEVVQEGVVQGLKSSFFAGAPPSEIGEATPFDIQVQVENTGGHTVPAGEAGVHIRGLNPNSFEGLVGFTYQSTNVDLLTVQEFEGQQVGGMDILTWPELTYSVDIDSDQKIKIVAQTCYDYQTDARAEACFNQNAYAQTTGAETCKVQGSKSPKNSGAPVQVAEIMESPAGLEQFRFIFKIKNVGGGTIYDNGAFTPDTCISATKQDLDKVYITDLRLGAYSLLDANSPAAGILNEATCTWRVDDSTGLRYIRLVDGEGQFMCTLNLEGQFYTPVFSDLLSVILDYGYTDQISTTMKVKAIPGVSPQAPKSASSS